MDSKDNIKMGDFGLATSYRSVPAVCVCVCVVHATLTALLYARGRHASLQAASEPNLDTLAAADDAASADPPRHRGALGTEPRVVSMADLPITRAFSPDNLVQVCLDGVCVPTRTLSAEVDIGSGCG